MCVGLSVFRVVAFKETENHPGYTLHLQPYQQEKDKLSLKS